MLFLSLSNISILCSIRINLVNTLASPVNDNNAGEGAETEHPEPEKDVNLLVEDVKRQDAERVMLLKFPACPKFMECTLCQPEENQV